MSVDPVALVACAALIVLTPAYLRERRLNAELRKTLGEAIKACHRAHATLLAVQTQHAVLEELGSRRPPVSSN